MPGVLSPSTTTRRALDVGCGYGALLDVLAEVGWETWGVEPGDLKAVAAVRHRIVDDIPADGSFDLAILHHVLEHLLEPGETLRHLHRTTRSSRAGLEPPA